MALATARCSMQSTVHLSKSGHKIDKQKGTCQFPVETGFACAKIDWMKNPLNEDEPAKNNGFMSRVAGHNPPHSWRTWLIGNPLPTADAPLQTVSKAVGLAIFGADALSSIAYAPQETLVILAAAGAQAFHYAFPISIVITVLLAIVTISYIQTIHAYPSGGGAYT